MKIEKEETNVVIGELLTKEKYKFLPNGLVGEICRDFVDELDEIDNK